MEITPHELDQKLSNQQKELFEFIDNNAGEDYMTESEAHFVYGPYGVKFYVETGRVLSFNQMKWLRNIKNKIENKIG